MSLGIHRVWKRIFVNDLAPRPHHRLLDLAGGTGDITFGWRAKGGGSAILSDINAAMLSVGRDRALDRGIAAGVTFLWSTEISGWRFQGLVVVRDGVVLFRNYGGEPQIKQTERQSNPLGPLQPAGEAAGALIGR